MTKTSGDTFFTVHWKKKGTTYYLEVLNISGISAEHESFSEAEDLVVDRIHDRFGELGLQVIFDPPKPFLAKGECCDSGWVLLVPNVFCGSVDPVDALFSDGRCRLCRLGTGARNDSAIKLQTKLPNAIHMGYVAGGYPIPVVSQEFLKLFSQAELCDLELRKCHVAGRPSKREFFELLPKKLRNCVDTDSLRDMVSWKCDVCRRVQVDQYLGGSFRFIVNETSLPSGAQLALVGFSFDYDLAMPQNIWNRISKTKEAKGLAPEPLAKVATEFSKRGPRKMLSEHWKLDPKNFTAK